MIVASLGVGLVLCFLILVARVIKRDAQDSGFERVEFSLWASAIQVLSLMHLASNTELDIEAVSLLPMLPIGFIFDFLLISLFLFVLEKVARMLRIRS